jgi:hypothetical protein
MAARGAFLELIFMPGTTVEIIVIVVVLVLSTIVVMVVGPVVVLVVTNVDKSAVDGTEVGTTMSVVVGVSGVGAVVSSVWRPRTSLILRKSSLLWYLRVCFIRAIGCFSIWAAVATLDTVGDDSVWACTQLS